MTTNIISKKLEQIYEDINYVITNFPNTLEESRNQKSYSMGVSDDVVKIEQNDSLQVKLHDIDDPVTGDVIPNIFMLRTLVKIQMMRVRLFTEYPFSDPAWDMFLELAAASGTGRQITVSSLCIAANAPSTTALRYISVMVKKNIFKKVSDPSDRRRIYVQLTKLGEDKVKVFSRILHKELLLLAKYGFMEGGFGEAALSKVR